MKIKKVLYFFLLLALFLPLIQFIAPFQTSGALNGWQQSNEKPMLAIKDLFNGEFQEKYELYYKDNTGFYPDFVRLRNQIYYSCFHLIFHDKTLVGKENYFYEKGYINNALFGMYAAAGEDITEKSKKLSLIQDTLQKMGKEFLFVFAPGKGTYFPEYIPNRMFHHPHLTPPHIQYLKNFKELGINYIDFDKWFIELKKQNIKPLYSKNGIHWNKYGCYLAIDSLSKYFNKKYPYMPKVILDSIPITDEVWKNENDCYESANLIQKPQKEKMPHPEFHYTKTKEKRLKCIFVGDSYIWPITLLDFNKDYFENSQYWYYFKEISYVDNRPHKDISEIDILKEIQQADVIMIMFTNATTLDADCGFTEELYKLFYENKK